MSQTTVLNNQDEGQATLYIPGKNVTLTITSMTVTDFLALAAEREGFSVQSGVVYDVIDANGEEVRVTDPDTQTVGPGASVIQQFRQKNG